MKARILVLAAMLLLGACVSDRPLAFQCPRFEEFRIPVGATPADDGTIGTAEGLDPLVETIATTFQVGASADDPPPPSNFLILSGGGHWGAFGAGFLKGWSDKGTGTSVRPPRFDLVTGVSTGSLQSTFAFIGSTQDQALIDAYTIANERVLVRRHGTLFFLRHASMADLAPLETYIRARLEPLMDQVAAPENEGRRLLVGVVDGLDGRMYAVDMTRIARELTGRERQDCYAGALLASSAVPVVFRQVTVDGRPYLDGGVRQSVFVTDIQDAAGRALAAGGRAGNIYVLMNGDTTTQTVTELKPELLPTLGRLRSLVFNQIELSSIYNVAARFPNMTTYVATAAGHACDDLPGSQGMIFPPETMNCLRDYGLARWNEGVPWTEFQRPE